MTGPSRWLSESMTSFATTTCVATPPPGTREGAHVPVLVGRCSASPAWAAPRRRHPAGHRRRPRRQHRRRRLGDQPVRADARRGDRRLRPGRRPRRHRLPLLVGVGLMRPARSRARSLRLRLAAGGPAAAGRRRRPPSRRWAWRSSAARYSGCARAARSAGSPASPRPSARLGPLAGGLVEGLLGWRAVVALPVLGSLVVPALWRWVPTQGPAPGSTSSGRSSWPPPRPGLVLLVQSPSPASVAVVGALLARARRPGRPSRVRRRPEGFLPLAVSASRWSSAARSPPPPCRPPGSRCSSPCPPCWPLAAGRRCQVGLALVPSRRHRLPRPALAGPLLVRLRPAPVAGGSRHGTAPARSAARRPGCAPGSAVLLVGAVVSVTFAFGLGQPALMAAVGGAVPADVRGVALGIATLVFLVGGGLGSAVVGRLRRAAAASRPQPPAARRAAAGRAGRHCFPSCSRTRGGGAELADCPTAHSLIPAARCPMSRWGTGTTGHAASSYLGTQRPPLLRNHDPGPRQAGLLPLALHSRGHGQCSGLLMSAAPYLASLPGNDGNRHRRGPWAA